MLYKHRQFPKGALDVLFEQGEVNASQHHEVDHGEEQIEAVVLQLLVQPGGRVVAALREVIHQPVGKVLLVMLIDLDLIDRESTCQQDLIEVNLRQRGWLRHCAKVVLFHGLLIEDGAIGRWCQ